MTPVPWVPKDIFFLSILVARGEAASPEPYQTVSTVYFILGIFENGPLEPGSVKREKVEKRPLSKETT